MLPSGSGTGYGQTNRKGTVVTGYQTGSTGGHLAPRIQASLQQAREKRQARMQGDDVSRRNMVVDEDGVAHDSECLFPFYYFPHFPMLCTPYDYVPPQLLVLTFDLYYRCSISNGNTSSYTFSSTSNCFSSR